MTEAPPIDLAKVAQQRILFVDDDAEFLEMIQRLMGLWSNNRVEVVCAASASTALSLLQSTPPDLIVLDVCMPVVDGLQLLAMVHKRFPSVPKVVLTSQPDSAYRDACLKNGAELFLQKPSSPEGFEAIFATLDELSRWKPQQGFRGMLRSVGLTDILQMECIAKSSSILAVTSNDLTGAIYIRDGSIIHAEANDAKGEEAFKQLIALISGDFVSRPFSEPKEETIRLPWESLLMDAAQSRDELLGSLAEKAATEPPVHPPSVEEATPALVQPTAPSIEIDELMICSDAGDVFHSWQCLNTELRINLLEFLAQRSKLLESLLAFGSFDRVEFLSVGSRLIAQNTGRHGVVVRSSLAGVVMARNDAGGGRIRSATHLRNRTLEWFQAQADLPGLYGAILHFPDRAGPMHNRSPQLTQEIVDQLRKTVAEGFQVSKLQKFHARRARWTFAQMVLECAQWNDGTIVLLLFNRRALELNFSLVDSQLNQFAELEES